LESVFDWRYSRRRRLDLGAQTTQGLIAGKLVNSQTGAPLAKAPSLIQHRHWLERRRDKRCVGKLFPAMLSRGSTAPFAATADDTRPRSPGTGTARRAPGWSLTFSFALNDVLEAGQYRSVFLPAARRS